MIDEKKLIDKNKLLEFLDEEIKIHRKLEDIWLSRYAPISNILCGIVCGHAVIREKIKKGHFNITAHEDDE